MNNEIVPLPNVKPIGIGKNKHRYKKNIERDLAEEKKNKRKRKKGQDNDNKKKLPKRIVIRQKIYKKTEQKLSDEINKEFQVLTSESDYKKFNDKMIEEIRSACFHPTQGLWAFIKLIIGPGFPGGDKSVPHIHGLLCNFLTDPKYGRFRDITIPRSFFKTATCSIAFGLWYCTCFNPKHRILIVSNVMNNAEKIIHAIRSIVQGNKYYRQCFPEMIPDKNARWSNRCAELGQGTGMQEGNWDAAGVGGGAVGRHYDGILEDDLIYPKKDDFTGSEISPSQEDIEKAIGFHKFNTSLFVDPDKSWCHNIGTRFAPKDLKNYIKENEKHYSRFSMSAEYNEDGTPVTVPLSGKPTWPERYHEQALKKIFDSQGAWMYATQYLQISQDYSSKVFNINSLRYYNSYGDCPTKFKKFLSVVDLASWKNKSKRSAFNVIGTYGLDHNNHIWILKLSRGNFSPTELYKKFKEHLLFGRDIFNIEPLDHKIFIEEIYYQEAMAHVAKLHMQNENTYFNLAKLPFDNTDNAKDIRIRRIEPISNALALHVHASMSDFVREFDDYPLSVSKDILDTLGWFIRISGIDFLQIKSDMNDYSNVYKLNQTIEDIEREIKERNDSHYLIPFPKVSSL